MAGRKWRQFRRKRCTSEKGLQLRMHWRTSALLLSTFHSAGRHTGQGLKFKFRASNLISSCGCSIANRAPLFAGHWAAGQMILACLILERQESARSGACLLNLKSSKVVINKLQERLVFCGPSVPRCEGTLVWVKNGPVLMVLEQYCDKLRNF